MKINGKNRRTVDFKDGKLILINQNKLPFEIEFLELSKLEEVVHAISVMQVRGAPAIGATGAWGLVIALQDIKPNLWKENLNEAYSILLESRPTAVDLKNCMDSAMSSIALIDDYQTALKQLSTKAHEIAEDSVKACEQIGIYGNSLIKNGERILTHCNAGALATVDFGTALAPMRIAHRESKDIFVYVDETRPRLQGARLTAFEMEQEGIDYKLIADNAAGYFMRKGEISLVITGADRIAINGDAANKIGTYAKAVLAKENDIPFYIAAPLTTFDLSLRHGDEIPIEERDSAELYKVGEAKLTFESVKTANPAFDVTPAKYITGYITEMGILKAEEIIELKKARY